MSTELAVIQKASSLPEVLRTVSRSVVPAAAERPVDIPKTVVLTDAAATAMTAIAEMDLVQADARRTLTTTEVEQLLAERALLDDIEKFIKDRKEAQRAMVFNHLDIEVDGSPLAAGAEVDGKGHWLVPGKLTVVGAAKCFSREIAEGSPSLSAEDLLAVVADDSGIDFTHDDYLACTTQVRVIDEAKTMLHLRRKPGIVEAIRQATVAGDPRASNYVRKA